MGLKMLSLTKEGKSGVGNRSKARKSDSRPRDHRR
jgi:hypothetical protein